MAFCKSCGTDIGDAKFCPACGTAQDVTPVQETFYQPITPEPIAAEPVSTPIFAPVTPSYSSTGDTSGSVQTEVPPVYTAPVYSSSAFERPNTTGSMVFSIVNIALGLILCCCYGVSIVSLVLGIIAAVFTSQANKAATAEEAQQKLKTAKIMNIIGVVFLALAIIIAILVTVLGGAGMYSDILSDYGYSY